MKCEIIFCMCIFLTFAQEKLDADARNKIAHDCMKEIGIKVEVIENVLKTLILPEDNQLYKDYLFCSYKKQRYQTESGEILYDNIEEFLNEVYSTVDARFIVGPCRNVTEGNSGPEKAFKALQCLLPRMQALDD